MHGQYLRQIEDNDKIKPWKWLKESKQKGYTDALICSAQ